MDQDAARGWVMIDRERRRALLGVARVFNGCRSKEKLDMDEMGNSGNLEMCAWSVRRLWDRRSTLLQSAVSISDLCAGKVEVEFLELMYLDGLGG
jgi:hypothetical protein